MTKYQRFFEQRVKHAGYVGVSHQLEASVKQRIDIIAEGLNRPAAEIYRELITAALPEFEAAYRAYVTGQEGKP